MDGVAYLVKRMNQRDPIGQYIPSEEKREIFVSEGPLSRSEYFRAGQNRMNPEIMLTTSEINYDGETVIEYKNVRYGIYRTFHKEDSDEIEMYLHRQAGIERGG